MAILPPRLCNCGHPLQRVVKVEIINAGEYDYQNGVFVPVASEADDDEVLEEYRCPYCACPLNIKSRGWFLAARKDEEE